MPEFKGVIVDMMGEMIILLILVLLSGFFSSAEIALFSIGTTKARHMAKDGRRTSSLICQMKEDPHRLLTTILIGNNLVNIAASSIATAVAMRVFGNLGIGIATGIMTFLILVFGEIFPKSFATEHCEVVARAVIIPIYWLSRILYPLILLLNFIPKLVRNTDNNSPRVTEDELITFVDVVHEEGEINPEERDLIYNVTRLDDLNVEEIMTPSADMFVIERSAPLDVERIIASGYTRIPVIDGDIDHVVGILNIKDLFRQFVQEGKYDLEKIMRQPFFIPESKKLDSLLNQFKRRKEHAAIVVNEYGEVTGIVTLEDVLEAIVGEIVDETDIVKPPTVRVGKKEWIVSGSAEIGEVNMALGTRIPESEDYDTFSGYVLENIGRIPKENEKFSIDDIEVIVKKMEGNRIKSFLVRKK